MIGLFTFIIIFTSILVALRLASKVIVKKQLSPEDYIAGLAQVCHTVFAVQSPSLILFSGNVDRV